MSGPGDGGNGFKKKDHNLEAEFSLDPRQEDVVCVDLEGEWSEQSKIYKHPDFDDTDIKFVSGEVGEGGDHMNLTFRNVSDKSVTIAGDVIVVIVSEDPNEQPTNQLASEGEKEAEEKARLEEENKKKAAEEQAKLEEEKKKKEAEEKAKLEEEKKKERG